MFPLLPRGAIRSQNIFQDAFEERKEKVPPSSSVSKTYSTSFPFSSLNQFTCEIAHCAAAMAVLATEAALMRFPSDELRSLQRDKEFLNFIVFNLYPPKLNDLSVVTQTEDSVLGK